MKEKPILFSTSMVRAILEGRKTQTRRAIKSLYCNYGTLGTRLYVRETFLNNVLEGYSYLADDENKPQDRKWKPSIHMPRAASRITLEITGVRVERLHQIGKDGRKAHDVLAEGVTHEQIDHWSKWLHPDDAPAHTFAVLWESIHGEGSWARNPFVWVIEFQRIRP